MRRRIEGRRARGTMLPLAVAALVAVVALAACSSAEAASPTVGAVTLPRLPLSETLAAAAEDRAEQMCDARSIDPVAPPARGYDQETWADTTEMIGRAPLSGGDTAAALAQVQATWAAEPALDGPEWDHRADASVPCADGHLYAVTVLARTPVPADGGPFSRVRYAEDAIWHREALVYGRAPAVGGEKVDLLLDLFLPPPAPEDAGRPTLVLIHGGGFADGLRSWHFDEALDYARRGFVVASIDYRVDPNASDSRRQHRAASYAAIDDGMQAVRWLRANADAHGIDPDRIAALGASAGGEIALALALLEDLTPDGPLSAVSPKVTAAFSTGAYLTPVLGAARLDDDDDAPVLLQFFETDTESGRPWSYAAATCEAVRAAGGTCDVEVARGAGHTVGLGPGSSDADEIAAFLAVHLALDT